MRVLSVLVIYSIMMFCSAYAQTFQSEFISSGKVSTIKEGDFFEATIRVWPVENADFSQFKKLEKTVLFNALYLAQIVSLGVSQNNADVVELKGLFIVKNTKPQPFFTFKYNNSVIELNLSSIVITELENKTQDYFILNQSLNKSKMWLVFLGSFVLVVILGVFNRKAIKDYLVGLRPDSIKKSRKKYDEIFRRAAKREDFEAIYQDKETWLGLLVEKAPAHYEFFKTMNQHQFKKEWGNAEAEEVKSSFDVIRRSFEK